MRLFRAGSVRQPAMKSPRSSSWIGLQAVSRPSPNSRNGRPCRTRATWPLSDLKNAVGRTMDQARPLAISSASKASLACWKASRGFCTQMADSSTMRPMPAALAAASALLCARWSMAQASAGAPEREARQDTRVSTPPAKPSRRSQSPSVGSPKRSAAPGSRRCTSACCNRPPTPARGRTRPVTSCPARSSARTVAWPMVPVAPRTATRIGGGLVRPDARRRPAPPPSA